MNQALSASLRQMDARVVVTGATGWLGQATCDLLETAGVQVYPYASRARVGFADLREIVAPPAGHGPLILFHYAFLTREKASSIGFEGYVAANVEISSRVLDWVERVRPDGIFLASSGAAAAGLPIADDPYGALKRLDELAFAEAARSIGARLRTARIYNVTGPHMLMPELYALGQIIGNTLRGQPIRIRASGKVERSFVAVDDLVSLVLADLLAPDRPDQMLFDTGGEVVEILELAQAVRSALGRDDLPIDRDWDPNVQPDIYLGDPTVMSELARRHGLVQMPLSEQIRKTAEGLR